VAEFLIHMRPDGKPMGVYTERESYYDPSMQPEVVERYVDFVRSTKGMLRPWEDWIESLAGSAPVGRNTWHWRVISHRHATLQRVLEDVRDRWRPVTEP
jgi:hypothetical protein